MTTTTKFHGVWPFLVTPLDDTGKVNEDVLGKLIESLIAAGVHGLNVLGSTGEFAYLNWQQKQQLVKATVDATDKRIPVVAGVAATSTVEAIKQAVEFERLGCDGLVLSIETYFPLPEQQVVAYFTAVAESVSCPVILYTNPKFQGMILSISVIEQLANIDNILYLKDASGDTGRLLSIMDRLGDKLGVFSASAHVPACVMLMGGLGWMAGPACLIPRQSVELYELVKEGQWDSAVKLQHELWRANEVFDKYSLAACIKGGLELQGFDVGTPIHPQAPLDEAGRAEVRSVLDTLGVL
jgi:4-hydroxy-tetrahydrodipicolinate synthase